MDTKAGKEPVKSFGSSLKGSVTPILASVCCVTAGASACSDFRLRRTMSSTRPTSWEEHGSTSVLEMGADAPCTSVTLACEGSPYKRQEQSGLLAVETREARFETQGSNPNTKCVGNSTFKSDTPVDAPDAARTSKSWALAHSVEWRAEKFSDRLNPGSLFTTIHPLPTCVLMIVLDLVLSIGGETAVLASVHL